MQAGQKFFFSRRSAPRLSLGLRSLCVWITAALSISSVRISGQESPGASKSEVVADAPVDKKPLDIVLLNGTIHVGDGSAPWLGHVGVRDRKIVMLSGDPPPDSVVQIDCTGMVVAPGFIDLHNHSDDSILLRDTRSNINYLLQGCTTVVTGNCGFGPVDVRRYLDQVDAGGAGTHIAHLLPQGSLRAQVMGPSSRSPSDADLKVMRELTETAMKDGAFGISTGLIYIPGTFTTTGELIELARIVALSHGIYASHIRNEGNELLASIDEAIRIGEAAGTSVHISHLKASGRQNWGLMAQALKQIGEARARGLRVTADQYPYTASSTSLDATLLPDWAREGGRARLTERLSDPEISARIREETSRTLETSSRIQLAACKYRQSWTGRSLAEIAEEQQMEIVDLVLEIERNGGASVINFAMSEDDLRMAMPVEWVATASDGGAKIPGPTQPHPRSFGTFPRKIGYYSADQQVLSLSAAIRSASGLPAEILGLTDRGLLKTDSVADIVIFDPASFRDRATFDQPWLPPTGMRYVLVDGQFAVYDGQATGAMAGRAIRKPLTADTASSASE